MALQELTQYISAKAPTASVSLLEKTHSFLEQEVKKFAFLDKKSIYNESLARAQAAADVGCRPRFVYATLLFDLARNNQDMIKVIKKRIDERVGLIVESYEYARQILGREKKLDVLQHSYRTARYLAGLKIDIAAICTALLHELPIHSKITFSDIEKKFGQEIAGLVQKFLRIREIEALNDNQYISNLREMVVAMAQDLRVIIIKMCSNLDRLKIYGVKYSPRKLENIARESRDILAPIANLLGIWHLRWQLEDLAFKILQPEEYEQITRRFHVDERKNREKYIQKTINIILKEAKPLKINCQINGRFKHYYSIYQKMLTKKKSFNDICDVFALRIIVPSVDDCYRMLGIIHQVWKPKKKRVKDYIADPKSNNYRSLHTTVFGVNGRMTEFQIRTPEMEEVANLGISAHWYYKNPRKKTPAWMQELLVKQQQFKNDSEFLANFSSELLEDRVYVYTPKGDVLSLPNGSTPVDFAYQIHSEVGAKCRGSLINDQEMPLHYNLKTKDIVKIIIDREQAGPQSEWLDFVKTHTARKQIQLQLDKMNRAN